MGGAAEKLPQFHGRRFLMRGRLPLEKRYIRNNYDFPIRVEGHTSSDGALLMVVYKVSE